MRPPVRVRKARRTGKVGCGHFVLVGQQIVRLEGGIWHCRDCALLTLKILMQTPPQPGRGGAAAGFTGEST